MSENFEDVGYCENCIAEDGVIFLCDAGWYCEDCFRTLANVSEDITSSTLHDGINSGIMSPFMELVKLKYYGEVGVNNEVWSDEPDDKQEAERKMFLENLIDLTKTWGLPLDRGDEGGDEEE